nr:hypothetical protein [Tanacetum cinerariifolium]
MAALQYKAEHNKVGYLLKLTKSDDYHNIINFLHSSHIRYALTANPIIFDSLVKKFWSTATLRAPELGPPAILATIDRIPYIITEDLVCSSLQLADDGGVIDLPIPEIYSGMDALGYVTEGSWDQFGSPFAIDLICLPHSPDLVALLLEHAHTSTQPETTAGSFPSTKDAPIGGDFHTSPQVQKVHFLEAELHDYKKPFKDVVGKLVKKVKSLEVKLKTKKRKMVVNVIPTASPCALTNVPNATSTTLPDAFGIAPDASGVAPNASGIAPDASGVTNDASGIAPNAFGVAPGAYGVAPGASDVATGDTDVSSGVPVAPTDPIVPTAVPVDRLNDPAGASNKGKSPMIEEDISVPARTFRQMEEDRLGEEAARRLHEEEMVEMEKERMHAQRKRQQEKKRQALAEQLFKERQNQPLTPAQQKGYMRQYVKSFSDEQLLQEFEKICKVQSQSPFQAFSQTLKRPGSVLEEPPTKKPKSLEAPTPSMPEIPISPVATSPPSSRTRRKSLGRKHMHKPKSTLPTLVLDAPAQTFLKVVVNEDFDDEDSVDEVWSAFVGWEILSTPLGDINALYQIDDVSYPLSVELMKKMLLHKLEIDSDFVGIDLTTADS